MAWCSLKKSTGTTLPSPIQRIYCICFLHTCSFLYLLSLLSFCSDQNLTNKLQVHFGLFYRRVYPKVSRPAAWSENCKLYRSLPLGEFVSLLCESPSEFCLHNPLCCVSRSVYFCCCYCCSFRYRLSPKTFGYTLVREAYL
jgi:hypothetical protein